jgi:acyl-CoA reductase-like NAD-dependent aldehyde dehydrogenase
MVADPDVESESGWICAEGHGCAAPRTERVTVAGRRLPAVAVRAQAEADLIAAGCGVTRGLPRPVREALLLELRARFERASTRLVDAVAGQNGPAIRARLDEAHRAAACVARYLEAAKGRPRRSS